MNIDSATDATIARFWGKFGHDKHELGYHPLICHMIDVAVVARQMWDDALSPAARSALTDGLGMRDEQAARRWVGLLAGLHDIGKLCIAFQLQDSAKELHHLYGDLRKYRPSGLKPSDAPHGVVAAETLPEILAERGLDCAVAKGLASVVGGHHGVFPRHLDQSNALKSGGIGGVAWDQQRIWLVDALAAALDMPWEPVPTALDGATAMALAGLVSVADWIGSDKTYFKYASKTRVAAPDIDLRAYAKVAETQADKALRCLGWLGWEPPKQRRTFHELFAGIIPEPNDLQRTVERLAHDLGDRPGMLVIEAPMGEGKTEAAFCAADAWGVQPGPRGMYIALPTQGTSNQMLGRVGKLLGKRYQDSVVTLMLLHGQAALNAKYEELLEPELHSDDQEPREDARVRAAAWFTKRKHGLLAPFGVGTVDQALLAALQTRHVFVRLFGLAHKVVVIDEVHAYDAYMTALLERVLAWLGSLGSPVVLLSATLPPERRDALLRAYARGAGIPVKLQPAANYPRVTWLAAPASGAAEARGVTGSVHIETSERARRSLAVRWVDGRLPVPGNEGFALGEDLAKALSGGGCAAVICNTVDRAQQMYRALEECFKNLPAEERPELDLFHARFLYDQRDQRERRAVHRFGKPGESARPRREVLVATQVIEQSLDLDFDLMVTDFAPIDLLLQRSGRLHRHRRGKGERDRPERLRTPVLWVCRPTEDSGRPVFDGGDAWVYDPHILLRTWLELRRLEARGALLIAIPGEVDELVSRVYDEHRVCPEDEGEAVRSFWSETEKRLRRKRQEWRDLAESKAILGPETPVEVLLRDWNMKLEEEDPDINLQLQALTRVEERPSVSAVLLPETDPALLSRSRKPNANETRRVMGASVRLTGKGLTDAIQAMRETPSGWKKSPMLRHHYLVKLDSDGAAVVGGNHLHLDPDLGVVVQRMGDRNSD